MKTNTHDIALHSIEDVKTLAYFSLLLKKLETGDFKDEYERVRAEKVYGFFTEIVAVRNGYAVLEDGTIRCTPSCSSFVASYDECLESDMDSDYNATLCGY